VTDASVIQEIERAQKKMTIPVERLQRLLRDTPAERAKDRSAIYGLLASTEKRDAKILFIASRNRGTGDGNGEWTDYSKLSSEAIFRARDYYELAFKEDRTSWALVQKLALDAVIEGPSAIKSHPWSVARVLSEDDLYLENRQRVAWAHASLCELYLLAMLNEKLVPRAKAMKRAEDHAIKLVKVVGGDSFEVYSHYRQIERYTDWFNEFMPAGGTGSAMQILARPASEILERLPRHFKFD